MRVVLLLICAFALGISAKIRIFVTDTPLQKIGSRFYKKILLTNKYQRPIELTYDSASRNLFFMYMDDELQNSGRAVINVITKESRKIKGIARNRAVAVDAETSDVYFGSDDGLYKYDPLANEANNIGLYNMNIMKLVVRNNEMYLLDANDHMIYKVFDEGRTAVKAGNLKTVMHFEVDNLRNIHVVTMCGVYCALRGQEVIKNKDLNVVLLHFIIDGSDTFGITEDGLYHMNCENGTARKLSELDFFPNSITFGDYGDIFYSVDDSIIKLTPVKSFMIYNLERKKVT